MALVLHTLFVVTLWHVTHVAGQNNWWESQCETVRNGITSYSPCEGDPVHLLQTIPFDLSLEPPDATCGSPIAPYCEYSQGERLCIYCNSDDPHSVDHMYDLTATQSANLSSWWQSWTWERGNADGTAPYPQPMEVNITFSFNKTYELNDYFKLTFRNSRPRTMIIEKSDDFGVTFVPWQYYAYSCTPYFNQGIASTVPMIAPETVICLQTANDLPYQNAEVTFSATERFMMFMGANMQNQEALADAANDTQLYPFLRFTDIRVRLLYPATYSAISNIDLMSYYYAIANADAIAGCFCNLHGKACEEVPGSTGQRQCRCEHNAMGKDCELCLPLYNNRPWMAGSQVPYPMGAANECQRCECYDHADSCTYDVDAKKGRCNNCYHNTEGIDCENCIPGFYRNDSLERNDPNVCVHCQCEVLGVAGNNTECASPSGQCTCREHIEGLMCDRCENEYYGLLLVEPIGECKKCLCNLDGTSNTDNICDKDYGQCPCKASITGRICDQCAPGYYQFPTARPQYECQTCGCNTGGAVSQTCESSTGNCVCHDGIQGTKCSTVTSGFYIPAIDAVSAQPASGVCTSDEDIPSTAHPFSERNFYSCTEGQSVVFDMINGAEYSRMPLEWAGYPVLRYNLAGDLPWEILTIQLRVSDSSVDLSTYQTNYNTTVDGTACPQQDSLLTVANISAGMGRWWTTDTNMTFDIRCSYTFSVIVGAPGFNSSDRVLEVDSVVLAPDYRESVVYQQADASTKADYRACWDNTMSLATRANALSPADCRALTFGMMGDLFAGALPCECSALGTTGATLTTCADLGGQCTCKPGVFMRQCTLCAPGYYNITTDGCTNCQCTSLGSTVRVCDYDSGQCPCRISVATSGQLNTLGLSDDLRCRGCLENNFGYSTGNGCQQCLCSEVGSTYPQCDDFGVCTCNDTFGGDKCSVCLPGYYNFMAAGCSLCNCDETGSLGIECNADTGQCACRKNVQSLFCHVCKVGYFNLQEKNPDGCQACFCYGHGDGCESAPGYRELLLTAASIASWPVSTPTMAAMDGSVRDYYMSPAPFPGDRVFAYAQTLQLTIEPMNSMALYMQDYMPVVLEGNGGQQIFYGAPNTTSPLALGTPTTVELLLHEDTWYINATHHPDPFDMQVILQQLEAIYIAKQLGSVSFTVANVILTTAEAGPSPSPVEYVELCSCTQDDHVAGPFCDICAQGFFRLTLNGSSYETCQACDCSDNSVTEPTPICTEGDGICLNCRDGTTGDHCEACSANVISPGCTECVDQFWNISQTGCEPCDCDPVGSSAMVCDKVNGQCTCRDTTGNTITGRQCNECIDNYYNLQEAGCIECDSIDNTCYTLVFDEVVVLREKRDNLTAYTTYLMENDNNTALGPFSDRMQSMLATMQNLIVFLNDAKTAESTVGAEITRLNESLARLREIQEIDIQSALDVANTSIQAADAILLTAQDVMANTQDSAQQANDVLTGVVVGTLSNIDALLKSLVSAESDLEEIGGTAVQEASQLLDVVQGIEDIARHTSTAATDATAVTTAAKNLYDQTHAAITSLAENVGTTSAASAALVEEATNTTITAEAVRGGVQAIEQDLNSMEALGYDPAAMEQQAGQYIAQAAVLQAQSENATGENSYITGEVDAVLANTSVLMEQVATVRGDGEALMTRINAAYSTAMGAKATEQETFTNASNMLSIMQNFDTLYSDAKAAADAALAQVQDVQTLAETAIANANTIQADLQPAKDDSTEATDIATYTEAGASGILTQLSNLSAGLLSNEAAPLLNDLGSRVSQIAVANQTKVMPADTTCDAFASSFTTLETDSATALTSARSTLSAVENTQSQAASLLAQVNNIQQLDGAEIEALRQGVSSLQAAFDQSQLVEMIAALKATKETQGVRLTSLQEQKAMWQARVGRLKFVRDQLTQP